jgi:RNA polymerase sigma-70 factor (ECF subfamily)
VPEPRLQAATFEELAMPLFDQLYNFAHWLAQDRSEAEDLVQETYAKALRGFAGFQPGTNFRAWIYRILRNTFLTSRTGLKAIPSLPLNSEDDEAALTLVPSQATPESLLLERDQQEVVQRALAQLRVHHREVLLLAEVEDMSYEEIAQTISVPLGTVMSRLARARQALREILREQTKGRDDGLRSVAR